MSLPASEKRDCQLVPIELMQKIWSNLYYDEIEAGDNFQETLNEVVDWLAKHDALPTVELSK